MNLPKLKYDEIYSNPLILLKSEDLEIYKCGSLLEILLYILRECLMANKNQMENFIIENHLSILNEAKSKKKILIFLHFSIFNNFFNFEKQIHIM